MAHEHSPTEVHDLLGRGEIQLVDVRTQREHEAGWIGGDVHIELMALAERAGEIDPARPVVFYCKSGARSAMATDAFRAAGFDARNMTGGVIEWHALGLPLEPAAAGTVAQ